MRLALGWAWDSASGYLSSIPGQVRVLFFLSRNARQLPLPMNPRRDRWKPFDTKNPSAATTEEKICELNSANIGSRKHVVSSAHFSSSCLLQQRQA